MCWLEVIVGLSHSNGHVLIYDLHCLQITCEQQEVMKILCLMSEHSLHSGLNKSEFVIKSIVKISGENGSRTCSSSV